MLLCYAKVLNSGSSVQSNSTKGWTRPLGFVYVHREFNTYLIPYFWSTCNWQANTKLATDICRGRWHKRSPLQQIRSGVVDFYWATGLYVISIVQEYILLIDNPIFTYIMRYDPYTENSFDQRRNHIKWIAVLNFAWSDKSYIGNSVWKFFFKFSWLKWFYVTLLD